MMKVYRLVGSDGAAILSALPGRLGGHRRNKVYGRLDCPGRSAGLRKATTSSTRVFFADEATAIAAGYRPCANCLPDEYRVWKAGR